MKNLRIPLLAIGMLALLALPAMAQFSGQNNVTPRDCSGVITTGGTAQNAFPNQGALRGFIISNLSTDPMWISWTGTAAVGLQGSYLLQPGSTTSMGGSFVAPLGFGINTALSVIAATTGDKYSCTFY